MKSSRRTYARMTVYQDEGGKWRWRLSAKNGRTITTSGESFASHGNAKRAALTVVHTIAGGLVVLSTR